MCGLVGLGDFRPRAGAWEHDMFSQMLVGDSVRGIHGTGILKIYCNGGFDWRKIASDPYTLFSAQGVAAFMGNYDKKDVRFLVGHNRSATTGDRSDDSAHPFQVGKIILMHNGTLEKYSPLLDFDKFPVDSEAIANSIDKEGIEKTLNNIRGAYALVYYDSKAKTLNLIRNKERPLFLGVHADLGRVYFASEYTMLKWILARNNISSAVIEMLPEHQLVSFGIHEMIPKIRDMKDHVYTYKPTYSSAWVNDYGGKRRVWNVDTQQFEDEDAGEVSEAEILALQNSFKKKAKEKKQKKSKTALVLVADKSKEFLSGTGALTSTEVLYGYRKGMSLQFEILDYNVVDKEKESWRIEGIIEYMPGIKVFAYIKGNKLMDALTEEKFCRGTIINMQYNLSNKQDPKASHRIWVTDPAAVKDVVTKCEHCGGRGGLHQADCKKFAKADLLTEAEEQELKKELQQDGDMFIRNLGPDSIN